jgi:16S rRNA (cytosine1402-N4)-methyltransferase
LNKNSKTKKGYQDYLNNSDNQQHTPVLVQEALELLNVREGPLVWVDATVGGGGHLNKITECAGSQATIVGVDRDAMVLDRLAAQTDLAGKFIPIHSNYSELPEVLSEAGIQNVSGGILADLGVSSLQLNDAQRGFSFTHDGPLDMRMDSSASTTASQLIDELSEEELSNIIRDYGEERYHRAIARALVHHRPIKTTGQLAKIVAGSIYGASSRAHSAVPRTLHPATRTFQALRIAVNDELNSLKKFVSTAIDLLSPGARLAIISFHSLEDRIVKQMFKQGAAACICPPRQPICTCGKRSQLLIITRKAVTPGNDEKHVNPRSRSAKLRVVEKLA